SLYLFHFGQRTVSRQAPGAIDGVTRQPARPYPPGFGLQALMDGDSAQALSRKFITGGQTVQGHRRGLRRRFPLDRAKLAVPTWRGRVRGGCFEGGSRQRLQRRAVPKSL
ncbi:MAG: hypothetical protein ACRD2O_07120, partial [Terriglobia bacterium]